MRNHNYWHGLLGAVLLAAIKLGTAQKVAAPDVEGNPAVSVSEEDGSNSVQSDGIKVHGHWAIEVRNPDGSLASHTEFENAIQLPGKTMLVQFLGRAQIPGNWVVTLGDGALAGPCMGNGKAWICLMREANDTVTSATVVGAVNNSLTVSLPMPQTTNGIPQLVLAGSATAANNSSIKTVGTLLSYCARSDTPPPSACTVYGMSSANVSSASFSQAVLTNPIVVTPGQAIQVVITFTFS